MTPSFDLNSYLLMMLEPSYSEGKYCLGEVKGSGETPVYVNLDASNADKFVKEVGVRTSRPKTVIESTLSKQPRALFLKVVHDLYKVEYNSLDECILDVFGTIKRFLVSKNFMERNSVTTNEVSRMNLTGGEKVQNTVPITEPISEVQVEGVIPVPTKVEEVSSIEFPKPASGNSKLSKIISARKSSAKSKKTLDEPSPVGEVASVPTEEETVERGEMEEVTPIIRPLEEEAVYSYVEKPKEVPKEDVVSSEPTTQETLTRQTDFGRQLQVSLEMATESKKYMRQVEEMFLACASDTQMEEYRKNRFLKDEGELDVFITDLLPHVSHELLLRALGKTLRRRWRDGDSREVSTFVEVLMDFLD